MLTVPIKQKNADSSNSCCLTTSVAAATTAKNKHDSTRQLLRTAHDKKQTAGRTKYLISKHMKQKHY